MSANFRLRPVLGLAAFLLGPLPASVHAGTGTVSAQNSVAMEVSGQAKAATTAQLICSSTQAADVNHAEITALKVPRVRVVKG